ncbi:MAG: Fur family transcriptional regulator [Flavobacteriales bacterium]
MKTSTPFEIELRNHGLKATPMRTAVLAEFKKSNTTLSQAVIEKKLGAVDRVTLYRTLRDMEASGIIHKVISAKGETKFALCAAQCSDHAHEDNHIHFTCTACEETYCLTEHKPRNVSLPAGFVLNEVQVIASGVCMRCSP